MDAKSMERATRAAETILAMGRAEEKAKMVAMACRVGPRGTMVALAAEMRVTRQRVEQLRSQGEEILAQEGR